MLVNELRIPMELTDEVFNAQFYDKVDGYKTLQYNGKYRLEGYGEKCKIQYNIFFDFETITSEYKSMPYHVGFTMMTYSRNVLVLILVLWIC